jgi:hypothetical protein
MKKTLVIASLLSALTPAIATAQPLQVAQLKQWRYQASFDQAQTPALIALLKSEDNALRQGALEVFLEHQIQNPRLIEHLPALIQNDTLSAVRGVAAAVLVQQGSVAYPVVKELLIGSNLRVRQTVATAVRGLDEIPAELREAVNWASPPHALNGPTLHPNSGFEAGLLGWDITLENGALGKWEIDQNFSHEGKNSLRLTKENGVGFIRMKSTFPLVVPAGETNLTWRGWFRAQNAPINSILSFRLLEEDGKMAADSIPGNSARWQSQSLLRNTPDHVWDKRVFMVKPSTKERRYYMEVMLYGNSSTVWLDDLDFPATPWNFFVSDPVPSFPAKTRTAGTSATQPTQIKVTTQNNRTELRINNQQIQPVLQFPFVSERGQYSLFDKAGIPLQTVVLELTDTDRQLNSGSLQEPSWPTAKNENYQFASLLRRVERAAQQMPNSKIILGFHVMWPRDYVATFPETEWHNHRGEKAYGNWLYMSGFTKTLPNTQSNWWPSQYQDKPFEDAAKVIRAFMQELKKTSYANKVAGAFISGGQDGQFYIKDRDYSPAGTLAWQNWLKAKYQTPEKLNQTWKTTNLTFDQVKVPQERQAYQVSKNQSPSFFDPATEGNQRDFEEYRTERMWRIREILLQAADEGIGRDILGITWSMGGALVGNIKPLLESKYLDGIIVQPGYEQRMPGYVGGVQAAYRSFAKHGKFIISELDTRSWLRETYNNEIESMKISTPMNADWFQSLFRKESGQLLAEDQGWWYYDISHNAFNHPAIQKEIVTAKQTYDQTLRRPRDFKPEVAYIYSHESYPWSRTTQFGFRKSAQWLLGYQDMALNTAGIAADRYYLNDFMALGNWDQYKTVVFVNTYYLGQAEREFINQKLKNNQRTLIWHYASGYLSDKSKGAENIGALTGINAETAFPAQRQRAVAVTSNHELAKSLQPLQGMADIFRTFFRVEDEGDKAFDAQRFWVNDPTATTLAQYPEDNKTAIAVKDFPTWRSVYVAPLAGLSSELLHSAVAASKGYIATQPGKVILHMNDRFISVHGLQTGTYRIQLPRKASVIDVDSGKSLASNATAFDLPIEAQQTKWLRLEN